MHHDEPDRDDISLGAYPLCGISVVSICPYIGLSSPLLHRLTLSFSVTINFIEIFSYDIDASDSWPLRLVNAPLRAAEMFNFCPFHRCFLVSDIPFFFIPFARSPACWRFSFSQSSLPQTAPSPSPSNHSAAGHVFTPSRSPYLPLQQFS